MAQQGELFENPERDARIARRREILGDSWYEQLGDEFDKPYMRKLSLFLANRRREVFVYPEPENVFRAYQLTPYENVKVCLILQDPYNDGTATGVAMGVKNYKTYPKTIDILDKAIEEDMYNGFKIAPTEPDLEYLCKQGVLLTNTALTVEHRTPNSHQGMGWHTFIRRVIEELNKKPFVVFMLWGSHAQSFKKFIADKHEVIEAEHPIKHKYEERDRWEHGRPFSKANTLLENHGLKKVFW